MSIDLSNVLKAYTEKKRNALRLHIYVLNLDLLNKLWIPTNVLEPNIFF
jgi:hypothetical protein